MWSKYLALVGGARIAAENAATLTKESDETYTPPTSSLQRTLQDIENSIKTEKKKLTKDAEPSTSAVGTKTSLIKNKPTGTPEYNPTPLTELKEKKIKGQLGSGRSKYDLALLDGPDTDGEYDPASNFSTSISGSNGSESIVSNVDALPDYARQLSSGVKRKNDDSDEPDSPLAKIPKFVSVEYTPTVMETTSELTEEEDDATDNKDAWFSDEKSDKDSESEITSTTNAESDNVKDKKANSEKNKSEEESTKALPLEFTAEGFVKNVYVETKKREPVNNGMSKKTGKVDKKKSAEKVVEKDRKDFNIFNMFKEEFDNAMDICDPKSKDEETNVHKVKLKSSNNKSLKGDKDNKSLKGDKESEHQPHSKSSSVSSSKQDSNKSSKHHDKSVNSHHQTKSDSRHKHSSTSSKESGTGSSSTTDSNKDKSAVKNGINKSDKHSSKHKHLSSSTSSSSSKTHKDSKERDTKDQTPFKENSSSKSHTSSKHTCSSHSKSAGTAKHEHRSSSSEQKPSSSSDKHKDHKSKHDKGKSKNSSSHSGSHSSHSKDKSKERKTTHSDSSKRDKRSNSSAKQNYIVNLDVDLFGKVASDNEDSPKHDFDDDMSDLEKYFEEDPFEECLKIFNEESAKPSTSGAGDKKKLKKGETEVSSTVGKKRVALKQGVPDEKKRKLVENKPKPKPSPAQVMMNRYKMMQEKALEAEKAAKEKMKAKVREISVKNKEKALNAPGSSSSSSLASASTTFTTYIANKNKKTSAITVAKGAKRKAHVPTVPIAKLKRPVVEVNTSSKVGTNVRQRYLNAFIDEFLKLCSSEEEAYKKGKLEEETVYNRCSNKKIYLNIAVNTIKRLRTEAEQKTKGGKTKSSPKKLSHASVLDGNSASKASYTLHRSGGAIKLQDEDFLGADLYKRLTPYILSETELKENNFPRPHPEKGGTAVFYGEDTRTAAQKGSTKGYEKLCIRCGKVFEVYPNGKYPIKEECVYHWGKAWKKKIAGFLDTRYTCCQGDLTAEGCQVAKLHVHESNKRGDMTGFMKTIPTSPALDGDYGVYALDCEMVYTTMGIELARVTVVGADQDPVYESLVVPDNPVVDFNTRFSGISEEDLEGVHTSQRDVQAVLLSLFTDKTILMGHSLESDLLALKLIHSTVVDTSVVFPHRMGPPFKRALRNLMAEILQKIIQDDVGGHDSLEDALACLQLMQYRLKEDARKQARRLSS